MLQAELKVLGGKFQGKAIPLTTKRFLVGREQDCHLRPNSDSVSRHHCVFVVDDYTVRLRDLGSTNGTKVNGELIRHETVLSDGDQIQIGKLQLQLVVHAVTIAPAAAATPSAEPSGAALGLSGFDVPTQKADLETTYELPTLPISGLDSRIPTDTAILSGNTPAFPFSIPPAITQAAGYPIAGPPAASMPVAGVPVAAQIPPIAMPPQGMPAYSAPQGYPGYPVAGYPQGYPAAMPGYLPPGYPATGYPAQPMPYATATMPVMAPPAPAAPATDAGDDKAAAIAAAAAAIPMKLPPPESTGVKEAQPAPKPEAGAAPAAKPPEKPSTSAADIIKQYMQRRTTR